MDISADGVEEVKGGLGDELDKIASIDMQS